jgi:hypothetical protein
MRKKKSARKGLLLHPLRAQSRYAMECYVMILGVSLKVYKIFFVERWERINA